MKHDWKAIIGEYKRSGLSQAEFSRTRKVNANSLSQRLKLELRQSSFVRLETGNKIELEVNGFSLKFEERLLAEVLKVLRG